MLIHVRLFLTHFPSLFFFFFIWIKCILYVNPQAITPFFTFSTLSTVKLSYLHVIPHFPLGRTVYFLLYEPCPGLECSQHVAFTCSQKSQDFYILDIFIILMLKNWTISLHYFLFFYDDYLSIYYCVAYHKLFSKFPFFLVWANLFMAKMKQQPHFTRGRYKIQALPAYEPSDSFPQLRRSEFGLFPFLLFFLFSTSQVLSPSVSGVTPFSVPVS